MDKKNLLSIGKVSKLYDVHIKSLRYYDEIGVLKPHYVDPDNHYRYYSYQQLNILEAIQACIELEIPLKKFAEFTTDEGNTVNFLEILNYGKKIAFEKINSINNSLLNIESIQKVIEHNMQLPVSGHPIIQNFTTCYYFIKPINEIVTSNNYYEEFTELIQEANSWGYKTGYDMGKLFIYQEKSVKKFNFVQVFEPVNSKFILSIPAGERIEKQVPESRIEFASEEFPELFLDEQEKIVLESELITSTFNTEQPPFKLSCIQK